MKVADSDVLIDALRGKEPWAERIKLELGTSSLATTVVNTFELLSGAKTLLERQKVETLLAAISILPLSKKAALLAAQIRRKLESEGRGIGMADYLIAGICIESGCILLTRNKDHFERIPNLTLGKY